jgi:hypothetical protein
MSATEAEAMELLGTAEELGSRERLAFSLT